MGILLLLVFIAVILGVGGWVYYLRLEAWLKQLGGSQYFPVGKYLVGLEGCDKPVEDVECVVGPTDLIFAKFGGVAMGRIPRNEIVEVLMDDKSQLSQRLTATRMLALGVFALAAPKRKKLKEWCVAVNWKDAKGLPRATLFEFTGEDCEGKANKAANSIMRYVSRPEAKPDLPRETRECPYCAERIKAAAKVCRFCNRNLTAE